jgi:hypothetical protein
MKKMQTPNAAPVLDGVAVQAGGEQLRDRDHPVLRSRQSAEPNVGCGHFG